MYNTYVHVESNKSKMLEIALQFHDLMCFEFLYFPELVQPITAPEQCCENRTYVIPGNSRMYNI